VVSKYERVGRVTNDYDRSVTFDVTLTIGVQKQIIGQFTPKPGASTFEQSLYCDTRSTDAAIEVENICFGTRDKAGSCSYRCFVQCDAGTPNQPNCGRDRDTDERAGIERNDDRNIAQNGDSTTRVEQTADNNSSGGDALAKCSSETETNATKTAFAAPASSPAQIVQQVFGYLDANISRDGKYVARYPGQGETPMNFGMIAGSSTGNGLTLSILRRWTTI